MNLPNSTLVNQVNPNGDDGQGRGFYEPARYAVSPRNRPVPLGTPFFLPLEITLSGTVNENVTGQTQTNFNDDLLILGCETDIQTCQVQFSLEGTLPQIWSQFPVPVKTLCGAPDTARPVMWWPYPSPLRIGKRIQAQVLNVNGEGGGDDEDDNDVFGFIFNCAQPTDGPTQLDPRRLGPTQVIPIDSKFTGVAGEQTQNTVDPVDYDFLLQGFYTDLTDAQIRIRDVERRQWMSDYIPIWGVASRQSSQLNTQNLRVSYLIPQQQMISVEFENDATIPEASGQLYMVGQILIN